jgi:UDP-glucose 4-epimerase
MTAPQSRCLITGGGGYLASALVPRLVNRFASIRRMSRPGKTPEAGGPLVEDFSGDVRNKDDLEMALAGCGAVFHLAAQTSLYFADAHPYEDLQSNVGPLLDILEISRSRPDPALVIAAGTVTQMGLPERMPADESHADKPASIYDMHKLLAEHYLEHYARNGWAKGATLRLANVYGPGPRSGSADRGVLNAMVRKALQGEKLKIFGQGDFMRDYVYIDDVADAFALAADHAEAVNGRHFIIATGLGHTFAQAVYLVADRVGKRTGKKVEVEHVTPPATLSPVETRNFTGDSSAFTAVTGWRPAVGLQEGIDRTIEHFLQGGKPL